MTVACVKVFPKQRNLNLPYVLLSALATILTAVAFASVLEGLNEGDGRILKKQVVPSLQISC
jgi:hypothetical protein